MMNSQLCTTCFKLSNTTTCSSCSRTHHQSREDFGLPNPAGHQNCFLNAPLQILLRLSNPPLSHPLITHPPHSLRTLLFKVSCHLDLQEFNLYQMSDACEAFTLLLKLMHGSPSAIQSMKDLKEATSDRECSGQCEVHRVFGLQLERECLRCGGDKLRYTNNYFAQEVYVDEIMETLEMEQDIEDINGSFVKRIRASLMTTVPTCNSCNTKNSPTIIKLEGKPPRVMTFNLTWNPGQGAHNFQQKLLSLYLSIPNTFQITDLYHSQYKNSYQLCGLICFYGNHYVTLFRDSQNQWKLYDDSLYRVIEGGWREIVENMIDAQIKPVMLFYQETDRNQSLMELSDIYQLFTKYHTQNIVANYDDQMMNDITFNQKGPSFTPTNVIMQPIQQNQQSKTKQELLKILKAHCLSVDEYIYRCPQCFTDSLLSDLSCRGCGTSNYYHEPRIDPQPLPQIIDKMLSMVNGKVKFWRCFKCTKMISVDESLECIRCSVKVYDSEQSYESFQQPVTLLKKRTYLEVSETPFLPQPQILQSKSDLKNVSMSSHTNQSLFQSSTTIQNREILHKSKYSKINDNGRRMWTCRHCNTQNDMVFTQCSECNRICEKCQRLKKECDQSMWGTCYLIYYKSSQCSIQ